MKNVNYQLDVCRGKNPSAIKYRIFLKECPEQAIKIINHIKALKALNIDEKGFTIIIRKEGVKRFQQDSVLAITYISKLLYNLL